MGDLVATCTSEKSRNRTVGVALGQGRRLDDIVTEMKMVAEGVKSTQAVLELAARHGVEMPIAEQVGAVLYEGRTPAEIVPALMLREAKPELRWDAVIVGALGGAGRAVLDRSRGARTRHGDGWTLDWWIGADDRWRIPAREPAVRQHRGRGDAGGGDAAAGARRRRGPARVRRSAVGATSSWSRSRTTPRPRSSWRSSCAARPRSRSTARRCSWTVASGLVLPFPPPRWDVTDLEVEPEQCGARDGRHRADRGSSPGTLRAAFLYPLSHRNRMRIGS